MRLRSYLTYSEYGDASSLGDKPHFDELDGKTYEFFYFCRDRPHNQNPFSQNE